MKAIILAAGRGSRINHITKYKPKALIKFKKKTLLQNQIEIFKSNKISKIYLVTGYMKNKFENYKVKKIYNKKWKSSNMIYSLLLAEKILLKEECIVSYGDVYYENDAIKKIKKNKSDFCLLNNKNFLNNWKNRYSNPLKDLETFNYNKKKNLVEIGNKSKSYKKIKGQFMGLFKTKPKIWKKIISYVEKKRLNINNISTTEFLNNLIANHQIKIKVIDYNNAWFEVDNKKDLIYLNKNNQL